MNRIIQKIHNIWNLHKFKGASFEHLILGSEFNQNFVIKHPRNLKIGTNTVISGNCYLLLSFSIRETL